MDAALGWLGQIAQWFGQFFPRWRILEPSMAAVKTVGWSFRRNLREPRLVYQRTGIVVWWPATTELTVHPVVRQANNLPTQTIETTDGKVYAVGAMIVYEVTDLLKLLSEAFDPDDTIKDIAASSVHAAATSYTALELKEADHSGELDKKMKKEAQDQLKHYGVKVLKMQLTDLAPCRVLRMLNSEPSDSNRFSL